MGNLNRQLACFLVDSCYEDLPAGVHEAKRVVLDSLGCAHGDNVSGLMTLLRDSNGVKQ